MDGVVDHWIGRNGSRTTASHEIDQALSQLCPDRLRGGTVFDGELVSEGKWGSRAGAAKKLYLFDVLVDAGVDVMREPWDARRARLERQCMALPDGGPVALLPCLDDPERFDDVHAQWLAAGLEGSVAKRRSSSYSPGSRSKNRWLKIKPQATAEALVVGYEMGKGKSNQHEAGALKIKMLESGAMTTTGFCVPVEKAEAALGHVIEIRHHGVGASGKPRHPIFDRFRPDLDAA